MKNIVRIDQSNIFLVSTSNIYYWKHLWQSLIFRLSVYVCNYMTLFDNYACVNQSDQLKQL